jgi:putative intracellular protease/amidase
VQIKLATAARTRKDHPVTAERRRRDDRDVAVNFVKALVAICHGLLTLAEAEVVRGHRLTPWPTTSHPSHGS